MIHRWLGRSGLSITPICLGTMMFGSRTEPEEAERIIARARDAGVTNILMKKGRPAFMLCALTDDAPEVRGAVLSVYLQQSSTLGVRLSRVERRWGMAARADQSSEA